MSQPKALFLADVIKADPASKTHHDEAAAELRRLHGLDFALRDCELALQKMATKYMDAVDQRDALLEALKNLEKEFRKVYPIYYYAEPWGHETNVPLQAARAAIARAEVK
jgi:hypothetical protein